MEFGYGDKCKITWEMLISDSTIRSIQEPVCEMMIEKEDFSHAYSPFLITLDGSDMTSFVDFFWRRSPVDHSCLEFLDADARMDIYEYLRDENLIPDMDKVHSGDWKFDHKNDDHKDNNDHNNNQDKKKLKQIKIKKTKQKQNKKENGLRNQSIPDSVWIDSIKQGSESNDWYRVKGLIKKGFVCPDHIPNKNLIPK